VFVPRWALFRTITA
jgi:hypothetical protein